ncbi:MAG: hypothetical protein WCH62_08195 [Candidatus Omnitrophota bacterium]
MQKINSVLISIFLISFLGSGCHYKKIAMPNDAFSQRITIGEPMSEAENHLKSKGATDAMFQLVYDPHSYFYNLPSGETLHIQTKTFHSVSVVESISINSPPEKQWTSKLDSAGWFQNFKNIDQYQFPVDISNLSKQEELDHYLNQYVRFSGEYLNTKELEISNGRITIEDHRTGSSDLRKKSTIVGILEKSEDSSKLLDKKIDDSIQQVPLGVHYYIR